MKKYVKFIYIFKINKLLIKKYVKIFTYFNYAILLNFKCLLKIIT
jgi:hypothetical protein